MTSIKAVRLEVPDPAAADAFYTQTLGLDRFVRSRESEAPSNGFRGFTLSLLVSQPGSVDALVEAALHAGANIVQQSLLDWLR